MEVHLLTISGALVEQTVVESFVLTLNWSENVVSGVLIAALILDEGCPVSHAEVEGFLLSSISIVRLELDSARLIGGADEGNAELSETDAVTI